MHRVLTHPAVMAVKAPVKDLVWRARGRRIRNPETGRPVRSMLFLCKGNICRSPFAAFRAEQLLRSAGIDDVRCGSAGLDTTQAARPPREAYDAAARFGVSFGSHVPTQLTRDLLADYDLTFVMEAGQLAAVRRLYPEFADRVVLLPLVEPGTSGYARYNIADPFGHPPQAFHDCYLRLERVLKLSIRPLVQPSRHAPSKT